MLNTELINNHPNYGWALAIAISSSDGNTLSTRKGKTQNEKPWEHSVLRLCDYSFRRALTLIIASGRAGDIVFEMTGSNPQAWKLGSYPYALDILRSLRQEEFPTENQVCNVRALIELCDFETELGPQGTLVTMPVKHFMSQAISVLREDPRFMPSQIGFDDEKKFHEEFAKLISTPVSA